MRMSKNFFKQLKENINSIKDGNTKTVFTIATTSKQEAEPYLTPIRISDIFNVCGCVIFEPSILTEIVDIIDGEVDYIFVDSEKKIPVSINQQLNVENDLTISGNVVNAGILEIDGGNLTISGTNSTLSNTQQIHVRAGYYLRMSGTSSSFTNSATLRTYATSTSMGRIILFGSFSESGFPTYMSISSYRKQSPSYEHCIASEKTWEKLTKNQKKYGLGNPKNNLGKQ